jgi:hypothetical protein
MLSRMDNIRCHQLLIGDRQSTLEGLRIIPGNRGSVRLIERTWLLMKRGSGSSAEVPNKAPRREANFTVGARGGHASLNCDSTRPAIGWGPQAKRSTQDQLVELGNPKELVSLEAPTR